MRTRIPRRSRATLCSCLLVLFAASCGGAGSRPGFQPLPGGPSAHDTVPVPGEGSNPPLPDDGGGTGGGTLTGGVLVTLVDRGERFQIWVTNPPAVQALIAIRDGTLAFRSITGPLRPGPGEGEHNLPWSWHLDPMYVNVNILTFAPVYAGRPSEVEANLAALLAANEGKLTGNDGTTLREVRDLR